MYNIYIKRAAELFGITYTRDIYQEAIEALHDDHARSADSSVGLEMFLHAYPVGSISL